MNKRIIITFFLISIITLGIGFVLSNLQEIENSREKTNNPIQLIELRENQTIIEEIEEIEEIIENEIELNMTTDKYYNYSQKEDIGTKKPENNHLIWELASGNLYFVDSADNTKVFHLNTSTNTLTQIDIDPNNKSAKGNTRVKNIMKAWHDRDSSIIYFGDCSYDLTHIKIWSLDYSGSETSPTITEEDTIEGQFGANLEDIVKIGNDIHVFYYETEFNEVTTTIDPDQTEVYPKEWTSSGCEGGGEDHHDCIDEGAGACPDGNYIYNKGGNDQFSFSTIDMSGYDGGFVYDLTVYCYCKQDGGADEWIEVVLYLPIEQAESFWYELGSITPDIGWGWKTINWDVDSVLFQDLNQAALNSLQLKVRAAGETIDNKYIECLYIELKIAGDYTANRFLKVKNLTDDSVDQHDMGDPTGRTQEISYCVVIGDDVYFIWHWSDEHCEIWKYDQSAGTFTEMEDCGANTDLPDLENLQGISYDSSDILFFILKDTSDSKNYLWTYKISTDVLTKKGEYNISLQLDRNVHGAVFPFTLEKAFHITDAKIYQIAKHRGAMNYISTLENIHSSGVILAITDTYLILDRDNDGDPIQLWKYEDRMTEITGFVNPQHPVFYLGGVPSFQFKVLASLSDYLDRGMFIQVIGYYTRNGSSTALQIIMEGQIYDMDIKNIPDQMIWVRSHAFYELTKFYPDIHNLADYTGKTTGAIMTQLLSDFFEYITAGTISNGSITWTVPADWELHGDKNLLQVDNDFCESEYFVAKLRPTGELDFDAGTVVSGVSIIYRDHIDPNKNKPVRAHPISGNINYVRVWGGIIIGKRVGCDPPIEAEDIPSQQLHGKNSWCKTYSSIFDTTYLQTIADNKLLLLAEAPLIVDITIGVRPDDVDCYYSAPDNFNDETAGAITDAGDMAWITTLTLPNTCSCALETEIDSHKKVLSLTHDVGADDPIITHKFVSQEATGIYEWSWGTSDKTRNQTIRFRGTGIAVYLRITTSKYYYLNSAHAAVEIVGATPTDDELDHFKLVWNCTTDTFDLYINKVIRVTAGEFYDADTYIDELYMANITNAVVYTQYIDAPGNVADDDYHEGDNLYPPIVGMVQPGETVYVGEGIYIDNSDKTIGSGYYIVMNSRYYPKEQMIDLKLSDGLHFEEDPLTSLPQENNQMIMQNAAAIAATAGGMAEYLHQNASADVAGYLLLSTTYPDDVKTAAVDGVSVTADDQELEQWVTASGSPGLTELLTGVYDLHLHAYKPTGTKDLRLYYKVYSRTDPGGVETLLGTSADSELLKDAEDEIDIHVLIDAVALATTDRIVIKLFAVLIGSGSNPTVTVYVEGDTLTRLQVPVSIGVGGGITVTEDSGAPTITPDAVGDVYINTDNLAVYMAAATVGAFSFAYIGKAQASAFDKDTIANLLLWFDASLGITKDGSDLVSQWNDQSDTSQNLTQAVGGNQPLWLDNQINTLPVLRFDGVDNYMRTAIFGMTQPLTIFMVMKVISNTGIDRWTDGRINDSFVLYELNAQQCSIYANVQLDGAMFVNGTSYIWTAKFNGVNSAIQRNDDAPATGNAGAANVSGFTVASRNTPGSYANIDVAEILIYDAALSAANIVIVLTYLNNKYGVY